MCIRDSEGNIEWLAKYWGDAARNSHIRGPRHNDGLILRALLDSGARTAGEESGFHAVAVDARSPKYDGGIATRLDCIPFGVVLNNRQERFYDEGQDIWPKRYATVSYTHLRAHETVLDLVCRLLLEK